MSGLINAKDHVVTPEEIAKLWMNENSVVNQKTAYFIAATAFLVAAISQASVTPPGTVFLAICGFAISVLTFLSVARTCTYREHLRLMLQSRSDDYATVLSPRFSYFDGFRSTGVLKALPLLALVAWGVFLASLATKLLKL